MRYPIKFIVTNEHGHRLGGTENREGTPQTIRFADGTETTATYWDGMWAPPRVYDSTGKAVPPPRGTKPIWSREIFHALVYRWGDYTIGIRASHLNGASLVVLAKWRVAERVQATRGGSVSSDADTGTEQVLPTGPQPAVA